MIAHHLNVNDKQIHNTLVHLRFLTTHFKWFDFIRVLHFRMLNFWKFGGSEFGVFMYVTNLPIKLIFLLQNVTEKRWYKENVFGVLKLGGFVGDAT